MALKSFFGQWKLMLPALLLAVILWAYANRQSTVEGKFLLSFAVNTPDDVIAIIDKKDIRVSVRGSSRAIERIEDYKGTLKISYVPMNIPTAEEGEAAETVHLEPAFIEESISKSIKQSLDIEASKITPDFVEVTLVRMEKKELKVEPVIVGKPAEGFEVVEDGVSLYPENVTVSGPAKILKNLTTIKTEEIDISGRKIPYFNAGVNLVKAIDDYPIEAKTTVEVIIDIRRQVEKLPLKEREIKLLLGDGFSYEAKIISKKRADVELSGPKAIIEQIRVKPELALLFVDVSDLKPRETPYDLPVRTCLPDEVRLVSPLDNVQVDIKERPAPEGPAQ